MHPALLWSTVDEGPDVRCGLCCHYCRIAPDKRGQCGVRENKDGALYTLVGDQVAALNLDPVEKKPLYHFHPGTLTLSFGTMGCNLSCSFCQNFALSQPPREGHPVQGRSMTPDMLVQAALENQAHSISYTYSEPTIFYELLLPTAKLALEHGLKNIMVSNGFMSPECLESLGPLIQAANIDLKSFRESFYRSICRARLAPVLRNLERMRELGWWLEVTTLLIPEHNDSYDELAELAIFIHDKLGPDTPWHLSRFHPDYHLRTVPPTPLETMERAWSIGREAGLRYVYVGNVPGHDGNNTYCPQGCGPLINRRGFHVEQTSRRCPECGGTLPGVGLGED